MENDFSKRIKNIEDEILALKTASEYSSVKSASATSPTTVRTGFYRVTFAPNEEPILARYFIDTSSLGWVALNFRIYARTPETNSQVIEVNTSISLDLGQTATTYDLFLTILSNRQVVSIERIS